MGNVQVYERPASADRSPWIMVGVLAAIIIVGGALFWGVFYDRLFGNDDAPAVVEQQTAPVAPATTTP